MGCVLPPEAAPARRAAGPRTRLFEGRGLLTLILGGAFALSLTSVPWGSSLVHEGGLDAIGEIAGAFVQPDLSGDIVSKAFRETWTTVSYAVAGLTVALAIGIPTGILASGTITSTVWLRRANTGVVRFLLAFFRSIHELVWAWLFVAAIGLSPMAAVLALGIPYGGILGRIYSELLQDVPEAPLRALRSSGAREWRVLLYGRLPMALPEMVSYGFYRLECGIRAAAVMSFVGLGGLGQQIQISLADLDYERMWTFAYPLMFVIVLVDIWSTLLRRQLAP
jgi:phosphonate transport system permease protein